MFSMLPAGSCCGTRNQRTWLGRTNGTAPLAPPTWPRRCGLPLVTDGGRSCTCNGAIGGRARADLDEPQATATATTGAVSDVSLEAANHASDLGRGDDHVLGAGEPAAFSSPRDPSTQSEIKAKAGNPSPQPVSVRQWRPSASGSRRDELIGGRQQGSEASAPDSAWKAEHNSPAQPSGPAQSSSTAATVALGNSAGRDVSGDGDGDWGSEFDCAGASGALPPILESDAARIDAVVARALTFDEAAFQGAAWADSDSDWGELAGPLPLDDVAAIPCSSKGNSSSRRRSNSSSGDGSDSMVGDYGYVSAGRRSGHDSGGGALADDQAAWEYGTYLYDNDGYGGDGGGVGGSPGDFRPKRSGRDGGRRSQARGGWGGDLDATEDAMWPQTQSRFDQQPGAASLDEAAWGDEPAGEFAGAGSFGGGRRFGGRKAAIASESRMRNALAAVSTRLPRIGLSVTFPLPPVGSAVVTSAMTAPAAAAIVAAAGPEAAPLEAPAPETGRASAQPTATVEAGTAASTEESEAAVSGATAAAAKAAGGNKSGTGAAAADGDGVKDWATVPLSYNFGPSFRLLEESAVPMVMPLPGELLRCAGALLDGAGGRGGHLAVGTLLPGCTAYTLAGDYEIVLVQDARSVAPALSWLLASVADDRVVGIDAEWPPAFRTGASEQLAMLQLASPSRVVLLHIAQMKRPVMAPGGAIHSLLSDPSFTWVGCGWDAADRAVVAAAFGRGSGHGGDDNGSNGEGGGHGGGHGEGGAAGPLPRVVVDVQSAARAAGWHRVGLLGLVTELLGVAEFQKPRRLSTCNWAAAAMNERQVRYAALDALLPPLLLRQLRLFAAMPALRCSFCKQAMHAPVGVQQHRPLRSSGAAPPAPAQPFAVCEHCGRSFWHSKTQQQVAKGGHEAAVVADADPRVANAGASGGGGGSSAPVEQQPAASKSKSKSLRAFLQSVVEGRNWHLPRPALHGGRPRRLLFPPDLSSDFIPEVSESDESCGESVAGPGSGSESDGGSGAGRVAPAVPPQAATSSSPSPLGTAATGAVTGVTGKSKAKRKKKSAARVIAVPGTDSPASVRQQALWDAFAEASPAAAAAVAMAMARGGDGGGEAAGKAQEGQGGGRELMGRTSGDRDPSREPGALRARTSTDGGEPRGA